MKFVVRLVVAFLMGCTVAACDGGSPTSPTPTNVVPPTTPVPPSGPVQLAELRGFELNAFIPGSSTGGGGAHFNKTIDGSIEYRVALGRADDYKLAVIIWSHRTGDTDATPELLATAPLFFNGSNSSVTLQYDSSKCFRGRCYVILSNRSDRMVERNDANSARVFGTPEL